MIDTEKYKVELEKKLEDVIEELKTVGIFEPKTGDWVGTLINHHDETDPNSHADFAEELEENTATLSDLELEYNNIKRALQKIETGIFGICEICQKEIEEDRLNFKPSARTCVAHMEEETTLPL